MENVRNPVGYSSLNEEKVEKIKHDLIFTDRSIVDLAKEYNVDITSIYNINKGKCWKTEKETYPLRHVRKGREMSEDEFKDVLRMLISRLFTQKEISIKFGVSDETISKINLGKYKKYKYPYDLGSRFPHIKSFPIALDKFYCTITKGMDVKVVLNLLLDFLNGNTQIKDLAIKHDVSPGIIKVLINNSEKLPYLNDLKYPLHKNIGLNISKLENKLAIYTKYE